LIQIKVVRPRRDVPFRAFTVSFRLNAALGKRTGSDGDDRTPVQF
jgi:hypothetical protein